MVKRRSREHLRIAMVGTRGMPANYGGVETVVDVLSRELVARGHEVTVFCRSEDYEQHPPMIDGVKLIYLPASTAPGLGAMIHAFRAAIYCIGRNFDIIHFHALGPGMMSIISRLMTKSTVVVTVHGRDDKRDKWGRGARLILRFAARISARVPHSTLVVSQTLAHEYADEFHRSTTVVPNSTNPIPEVAAGKTLARYGLSPQGYFVSVGRLVPEKAPHETIAGYREAMTEMPLVIVGGAAGTESYVKHLHDIAGGSDDVIFTGALYGDELAEMLTNAGGFVTSSHLEGLPTALIEAGRAAIPVIASDIPPHCEILNTTAGSDGRRVYPTGNTKALAELFGLVDSFHDEELFGAKMLASELDERYAPARTGEVHEQAYLSAILTRHRR
jgi:glycosyltransferase involved in cell wall biosynthesis